MATFRITELQQLIEQGETNTVELKKAPPRPVNPKILMAEFAYLSWFQELISNGSFETLIMR